MASLFVLFSILLCFQKTTSQSYYYNQAYRDTFTYSQQQAEYSRVTPTAATSEPTARPTSNPSKPPTLSPTMNYASPFMRFRFGFLTCPHENAGSSQNTVITLYWDTVMFECELIPENSGTFYGCDSSNNAKSCDATSRPSEYEPESNFGNYIMQMTRASGQYDICVTNLTIIITDTRTNDNTTIRIAVDHEWIGDDKGAIGRSGAFANIDPTSEAIQSIEGTEVSATPDCNSVDPTMYPTKEPTVSPTTPEPTLSPITTPTPTVSPTDSTSQPTFTPTQHETKFEFGFRTCDDSDDEHVITLFWELGMYQCTVIPESDDTDYICDADGSNDNIDNVYRECNPHESDANTDFQMRIGTLGSSDDAACIDLIYVRVIDANTGDILTDLTLNASTFDPYKSVYYPIDPDTVQSGDDVEAIEDGYFPYCDAVVSVRVTACDNFDYGSTSNSLQMQLKGTLGASAWFFVNKLSPLPTMGGSMDFEVWDVIPEDIGELYSVLISIDDSYGYCMANTSITISGSEYVFSSADYFGHGIILASACDYTFKFVSNDYPLLSCIDNYLELNTYSTRGIYDVDIHTCIGDDSGIAAPNMVDSVYLSIMGKTSGSTEWISSDPILLDHYVAGEVDLSSLGHLISSNDIIESDKINATAIYPLGLEGLLVGVKIESVNYEEDIISSSSSINVSIKQRNGTYSWDDTKHVYKLSLFQSSVFEDGRYLVAFFKAESRLNITSSSQIYIYGYDGNHAVNIYLILDGYNDLYKLPFYLEKRETEGEEPILHGIARGYIYGINWFDANDACKEDYGTILTSIHSEEEQFLIDGFMHYVDSYHWSWIGLFDLSIGSDSSGWRWIDGSIFDFGVNRFDANDVDGIDCAARSYWINDTDKLVKEWSRNDCNSRLDSFLCSSPYFNKNTNRKFEINIAQNIDEAIVVSVGNNNAEDSMCIDAISINGESARHISNNWIGGDSGAISLHAIFKYPVCSTEVIGLTIDYDSSVTNLINGDSTITGLECSNNNRLISTTCSISQSYEMSKTTSFSISNETSKANEFSWGSSKSEERSFGFSAERSLGVEIEHGPVSLSSEITLGFETDWTETQESNKQTTEASSNTKGSEAAWETTVTQSIECSAEAEVPPSHSMSYSMIFNAFNTTLRTYTDLKLTLCSAYTAADEEDESHYIYIDNIPGFIEHKEVTACEVQFSAAEYLRNDISCAEEQQLSISVLADYFPRCREDGAYDGCQCTKDHSVCWCVDETGNVIDGKGMQTVDDLLWQHACVNKLECENSDVSNDCASAQKFAVYNGANYFPLCREHNSTLYDGCQCDLGDSLTLAACWCVTDDGDHISGKAMQVLDGMTFEQVCVQKLQCENSDVEYQTTTTTPFMSLFNVTVVVGILMLIVVLYVLYKWCVNTNMQQVQYQKVSLDSDFDSESPLKL